MNIFCALLKRRKGVPEWHHKESISEATSLTVGKQTHRVDILPLFTLFFLRTCLFSHMVYRTQTRGIKREMDYVKSPWSCYMTTADIHARTRERKGKTKGRSLLLYPSFKRKNESDPPSVPLYAIFLYVTSADGMIFSTLCRAIPTP